MTYSNPTVHIHQYSQRVELLGAPPAYDNLEIITLPSGPVDYIANTRSKAIIILYSILKSVLCIGLLVLWKDQNPGQIHIRDTESAIRVAIYFVLMWGICPWVIFPLNSKSHMTLVRYQFKHLIRSWWVYFFILEQLVFLGTDPIGRIVDKYIPLPYIGTLLLIIANCSSFWIVTHFECNDYKPLLGSDATLFPDSEIHRQGTMFKVVSSTAFRIVFENVSYETASGQFTVFRKVGTWDSKRRTVSYNRVQFPITLESVAPGERITCIPETHSLPGAIAIPDFRSFGMDRGYSVTTSLHKGPKKAKRSLYAKVELLFNSAHGGWQFKGLGEVPPAKVHMRSSFSPPPPPVYFSSQGKDSPRFSYFQPPFSPLTPNSAGFPEGDPEPTGPTEYNVNTGLCLIVGSYLFLIQFLAKAGVVYFWFTDNKQHESSDWRYLGLFLVFSTFNVYLLYMVGGYKLYMTHVRLEGARLWKTLFPYLFVIDELILIIVPILGHMHGLIVVKPIMICIPIAFLNAICFLLSLCMETISYKPLQNNVYYPHLASSTEERGSEGDLSLKVIESSAFKIVIQNIGPSILSGDYMLVRKTIEMKRVHRKTQKSRETCQFPFKISWLDPGSTVALIPETHSLSGANQIEGHRSFGWDRKDIVKTSVYKNEGKWKNHLCVKFIQSYNRNMLTAR